MEETFFEQLERDMKEPTGDEDKDFLEGEGLPASTVVGNALFGERSEDSEHDCHASPEDGCAACAEEGKFESL